MILAAAAGDRVFLCAAQSGQGLARVENNRAGAAHRFNIGAGLGGGAGKGLEKIECGAFTAKQGARLC